MIDHLGSMSNNDKFQDEKTGSVNFHQFGLALETSATIYSYRIDDVVQSTYKVRQNVTRGSNEDEDDEENSDGELRDTEEARRAASVL